MRTPFYSLARAILLMLLFALSGAVSGATTLSIDGTRFLLNGKPAFLLGMSYYGGAGAPDAFVSRDFRDLKRKGFNWIRVWATWNAYDRDVSAVDSNGGARQPYMDRLIALVKRADRMGMVVDVTLTRSAPSTQGTAISTLAAHLKAMETLTNALKPYRNVYFDLSNERNIGDARHTPFDDLRVLRDRVKALDPQRLITASSGGDISEDEMKEYLSTAKLDFLTPHRPRAKGSIEETEGKTRKYLAWMKALGRIVPVHYQEPFRRGYPFDDGEITAEDFVRDAVAAKRGGAAGWCLHNGGERAGKDERPRRSFDLNKTEGRLFDQLDSVERAAADRLVKALAAD